MRWQWEGKNDIKEKIRSFRFKSGRSNRRL